MMNIPDWILTLKDTVVPAAYQCFAGLFNPGIVAPGLYLLLTWLVLTGVNLTSINRAVSKAQAKVPPEPWRIRSDNPAPPTLIARIVGRLITFAAMIIVLTLFLLTAAGFMLLPTSSQAQWVSYIADKWLTLTIDFIAPVTVGWGVAYCFNLFVLGRRLAPWLNRVEQRFQKSYQERKPGESDVLDMGEVLPDAVDYNPVPAFDAARRQNAMFLGLDDKRNPVHVPRAFWEKSHVQVMGPPGAGKGVLAGITMTQAIDNGDAVYWFCPKFDEWAPSVMAQACENAGVPFALVNLRRGEPAQINPFAGATPDEIYELLESGFALVSRGTDADHYRLGDRKAAYALAQMVSGPVSIPDLHHMAETQLPKAMKEQASGFLDMLLEMTHLTAIQTREGVSMASFIESGGCLYIVGHTRDEAVKRLQRMLTMRLIQIREKRPHHKRHVTMFLDEVKYLLSGPSLNALGTIRDKGMNILLAHQSMGDFSEVPGVEADSVRNVVLDTTPIKWFYRTSRFDIAKWISEMTSLTRTHSERRTLSRNEASAERMEAEVVLSDKQRNLIETNVIQHLPDACAVCIGVGIARLAFARPVKVQKRAIEVVEAPRSSPGSMSEYLDDVEAEGDEQRINELL